MTLEHFHPHIYEAPPVDHGGIDPLEQRLNHIRDNYHMRLDREGGAAGDSCIPFQVFAAIYGSNWDNLQPAYQVLLNHRRRHDDGGLSSEDMPRFASRLEEGFRVNQITDEFHISNDSQFRAIRYRLLATMRAYILANKGQSHFDRFKSSIEKVTNQNPDTFWSGKAYHEAVPDYSDTMSNVINVIRLPLYLERDWVIKSELDRHPYLKEFFIVLSKGKSFEDIANIYGIPIAIDQARTCYRQFTLPDSQNYNSWIAMMIHEYMLRLSVPGMHQRIAEAARFVFSDVPIAGYNQEKDIKETRALYRYAYMLSAPFTDTPVQQLLLGKRLGEAETAYVRQAIVEYYEQYVQTYGELPHEFLLLLHGTTQEISDLISQWEDVHGMEFPAKRTLTDRGNEYIGHMRKIIYALSEDIPIGWHTLVQSPNHSIYTILNRLRDDFSRPYGPEIAPFGFDQRIVDHFMQEYNTYKAISDIQIPGRKESIRLLFPRQFIMIWVLDRLRQGVFTTVQDAMPYIQRFKERGVIRHDIVWIGDPSSCTYDDLVAACRLVGLEIPTTSDSSFASTARMANRLIKSLYQARLPIPNQSEIGSMANSVLHIDGHHRNSRQALVAYENMQSFQRLLLNFDDSTQIRIRHRL